MKHKRLFLPTFGVLILALASCNYSEPPFSPENIHRIERDAAEQYPEITPTPLPTTAQAEYPAPGTTEPTESREYGQAIEQLYSSTYAISLQEAIHRSVLNNPDVLAAGYQTAQDSSRVIEAEAAFDPHFFGDASWQRTEAGTPFLAPILTPTPTETIIAEAGIKEQLSTGANVQLKMSTSRLREPGDLGFQTPNPYWTNELMFQITQPLLQNFGSDANLARVLIAKDDQSISLLDFRTKLEDNVAKTEEAYWRLYQAQHEVGIQDRLLELTRETADTVQKRYGHDVNNVQLWLANAAVEAAKVDSLKAKAQIYSLSNQLKQLMGDPAIPVSSAMMLKATDDPSEYVIHYSLPEQVDIALASRADLQQQLLRIDSAAVIIRAAKNNLLPKLDMTAQIGYTGIEAHEQESLRDLKTGDHPVYSLGFQFDVPIGNREARAILHRTNLQRLQAIVGYRSVVDQVAQDVTSAFDEVVSSWELFAEARQNVYASQQAVNFIRLRAKDEDLTPEFVQSILDRERALADAERNEVEARVNYNVAVSTLERAKGTILRYDNVEIEETEKPPGLPHE